MPGVSSRNASAEIPGQRTRRCTSSSRPESCRSLMMKTEGTLAGRRTGPRKCPASAPFTRAAHSIGTRSTSSAPHQHATVNRAVVSGRADAAGCGRNLAVAVWRTQRAVQARHTIVSRLAVARRLSVRAREEGLSVRTDQARLVAARKAMRTSVLGSPAWFRPGRREGAHGAEPSYRSRYAYTRCFRLACAASARQCRG